MPFSFTANSILLSTITDRGIQGAEPRLSEALEKDIKDQKFSRFGFTYNDVNYDDNNISSFSLITASTTVSALKSQLTSTFEDTLIGDDATDANGDGNFKLVGINDADEVLDPQALSIKIRDGNNVDIADLAATKDKTFCELSSSNPPPYKIEISNNLRLTTEYGDPRKKDYTATTTETSLKQPSKQYSIDVAGLCNLQPASMQVYTGSASTIKYIQGYNPNKWDAGKGFRPDSGFPTTGFYKAKFSLIGSGNDQSNYKCEKESGGDWVDYSTLAASATLGQGCEITYNTVARPTTPTTIQMSYKGTKVASYTLDYTDKNETKWAKIPAGRYPYGNANTLNSKNFPAASACKGSTVTSLAEAATLIFSKTEVTNTPVALGNGTGGLFARDVDSTFMGEWGNLYSSYSGSGWNNAERLWTSSSDFINNQQFGVHPMTGAVGSYNVYDTGSATKVATCRD